MDAPMHQLLARRVPRERSALGGSPRGWRCAVRPPEETNEMRDVRIADLLRNDVHALIRVKQTTPRFRHSPRDDPGDGASTRRPGEGRRNVRRRTAHCSGNLTEGQRFQAVALDKVQAARDDARLRRGIGRPLSGLCDFTHDQRQQALTHSGGWSPHRGNRAQFIEQAFEKRLTIRMNANNRRSAFANALERIEQRPGSLRRQARNVDSNSPHVRSPRFDRAMSLTGWDDQDIARFEHPRPALLDSGTAVDIESERREAVADRRTVCAVAERRADPSSEDRITVMGIIVNAYAWGRVTHDIPIVHRPYAPKRRHDKGDHTFPRQLTKRSARRRTR